MHIIAVGTTPWKLERLMGLCRDVADTTMTVMYNGPAAEKPQGAVQVDNNPWGRDVAMYYQGLWLSGATRACFLNDDVEYIGPEFWRAFDRQAVIAGVPNLSYWVDWARLDGPSLEHAHRQGRELRFIRTCAFVCDAGAFRELYDATGGDVKRFEKVTLQAGPYELLPATCAVDSNIRPYV